MPVIYLGVRLMQMQFINVSDENRKEGIFIMRNSKGLELIFRAPIRAAKKKPIAQPGGRK